MIVETNCEACCRIHHKNELKKKSQKPGSQKKGWLSKHHFLHPLSPKGVLLKNHNSILCLKIKEFFSGQKFTDFTLEF